MVILYAAKIGNIVDPQIHPEIMDGLSDARKEKILRYKMEHSRKQGLAAGLLLKYVLGSRGLSMEDISYGQNGKPQIQELYFNLSHSKDIVICAVSDKNVGCDVEAIATVKEGIAERFFTENENNYLKSFKAEEKVSEFFRLWTIKESYMKLTGEGMSLPLQDFDVNMSNPVKIYRNSELCPCHVKEYEAEEYKIAVCAEEKDFCEKIEYVML